MNREMTIREARPDDASSIAALAGELGYDVDDGTVASAIERLGSDAHAWVAEGDGAVVGWVHVHRVDGFQSPPYAEIRGLVVTEHMRRAGVGRTLMSAAEAWALEHGLTTLRLRSRETRTHAHRFYLRLGYEIDKMSLTFGRTLDTSTPTTSTSTAP